MRISYRRLNKRYYENTKELPKTKCIVSKDKRLIEIDKAVSDGNYNLAYDLADALIKDIDKYEDVKDPNAEREQILRNVIFHILEEQYKDLIVRKYNRIYNNIIKYDSVQNYKSSGYPGTIREYARSKTIDELMSFYRKSRYGGYMHTIIMSVIRKYVDQIEVDSKKQETVDNNLTIHEETATKSEKDLIEDLNRDKIIKSFMQER